jgi:sucrose-6-phosphate hydrolase SacC (GH32 family)
MKNNPSKNNYELIVEIENVSAEEFGVKVGMGKNQRTIVGYNYGARENYMLTGVKAGSIHLVTYSLN